MPRPWPAAAIISALVGGASPAAWAEPRLLDCETPHVTVSAPTPALGRRVCGIVGAAHSRFGDLGLENDAAIRIEITADLDFAAEHCVAFYSIARGVMQVLPPDCLAGRPGRLGPFPAVDPEVMFDSLVVHELTHAYLNRSSSRPPVSRLAHEYLAYAQQLDWLPPSERERIIAQAGLSSDPELVDFDEALLNLSPLRYAAMAWLHFSTLERPERFVSRIRAGEPLFRSLRE